MQKAGLITVAGGGRFYLPCQPDDFYSGRDLYFGCEKLLFLEEVKHFLLR